MSKYKAESIANYFIELASKQDESDLTNLKLQKLLYFAQGKFLAKNGIPLFSEDIEAWGYGPVVKDVYHKFKKCGSFPITVFDTDEAEVLSANVKSFIESIWQELGLKYSANYLVTLTHAQNTPWQKVYTPDKSSIVITEDALKDYFSKKTF